MSSMPRSDNIPPLGASQPSPQNSRNRNIIASIEYLLDTTNPLVLNGDYITNILIKITNVHKWLRSAEANTQTFTAGKEAVLSYIQDAEIQLAAAVGEYAKRGQTEKFFNFVKKKGREQLKSALNAW